MLDLVPGIHALLRAKHVMDGRDRRDAVLRPAMPAMTLKVFRLHIYRAGKIRAQSLDFNIQTAP